MCAIVGSVKGEIQIEQRYELLREIVSCGLLMIRDDMHLRAVDKTGQGLKLPHLDEHDRRPNFTVKQWNNRSLDAEVQAVQEVLREFEQKVEMAMENNEEGVAQLIYHAYIMCRIDTGFHCFGIYFEKDLAVKGAGIKLLIFDPSNMDRVDTINLLSLLEVPQVYDAFLMCPFHHFDPLPSETGSHYWGITAGREMVPCKKVATQLVLHRKSECGMLTYFAMVYFLSLVSNGHRTTSIFDCLGIQAMELVRVRHSVWDDRQEWRQFQSECIPQVALDLVSRGGERFVRRNLFFFKGLPFPKEFEVFSEFSPLGQILPQGTDGIVSNEQLWIETLQDARLMPQVGDTMFFRNSYLRLMLPSLPYPLASSRF